MFDISQLQLAMTNAGLNCPTSIIIDDEFYRFRISGDTGKPCWYVVHIISNDLVYASFGCFKRDISENWCSRDIKSLSSQEKEQLKQRQEWLKRKIQELQAKAKQSVQYIWEHAQQGFTEHPYLIRKQVNSYGLRLHKELLLAPLYNEYGELCSLQFIKPNSNGERDKWFKKDAPMSGCFFIIGEIKRVIYIVEGYATGATAYEATGECVVIGFNAGNLLAVAKTIRKKYPDKEIEIVIVADNDAFGNVNIGVQKATLAAQAINAKIVIPQFKDISTKPTDVNDLQRLEGIEEVRKQLANAKEVDSTTTENEKIKKLSQVSLIIDLTKDLELFHDNQGIDYATIDNNGHKKTWRLDSKNFQDWLSHGIWKAHQKAISRNTLQDALGILHGKASYEGICQDVYTRVALVDGVIYINLVNDNWEVIKVANEGWVTLANSPVKFTRTANMQPLPTPLSSGSNMAEVGTNWQLIWQYLNVPEKYRKLVLAFILECFRINTPYPILVLYGTQGSAKSTTQEIICMLIDPSACNLKIAPKKSEDLLIVAVNNHLVSFNNISHLSDVQQDELCNVSTGGTFSTRALYTSHGEVSINIKRPVIINGIGDLITAQDLVDRCITLELPEIQAVNRKTGEEVMIGFKKDYPAIFGSILDILVSVLNELPNTNLKEKPRMADFAMIGVALEKAMGWKSGSFMNDYTNNRNENMANALEHSPVMVALMKYMNDTAYPYYSGSFSGLLDKISTPKYRPDNMVGWVKSPKGLANQIKRQKSALLAVGIEVVLDNQRYSDGFHVCISKARK